ncbi:MAG: type II toxin-antitoxin system PemK/MazF family toxin [Bifidobacteriaceae bacterium]|jgi:mRNA interferase MazF|nr:type II toxin-antitoxin system PemK/MazF family toxin [Bifidobacteriaceae bacterium]
MGSPDASAARRGEIWTVVFGSGNLGGIGKTRPAVIMTVDSVAAAGEPVIVVPISSARPASGYRVGLPVGKETGLRKQSVAVCSLATAVKRSRVSSRIGMVPGPILEDITRRLAHLIGA